MTKVLTLLFLYKNTHTRHEHLFNEKMYPILWVDLIAQYHPWKQFIAISLYYLAGSDDNGQLGLWLHNLLPNRFLITNKWHIPVWIHSHVTSETQGVTNSCLNEGKMIYSSNRYTKWRMVKLAIFGYISSVITIITINIMRKWPQTGKNSVLSNLNYLRCKYEILD